MSLHRALSLERQVVLPPWRGLAQMIQPSKGTLVIILGAPGVGKSALSLAWSLIHSSVSGAPGVIVSLDSDLRTQAARTVSLLTGTPTNRVLRDGRMWSHYLKTRSLRVRMVDKPCSAKDVGDILTAETEYWGEAPALTVVDNVGNLSMRGDGEYTEFRRAFHDLHRAAREHGSCVLALHHVKRGEAADGTRSPRLSDGLYGGESEAELVLGLSRRGQTLRISVLKNRWSESDPSGNLYTELDVDLARMAFHER